MLASSSVDALSITKAGKEEDEGEGEGERSNRFRLDRTVAKRSKIILGALTSATVEAAAAPAPNKVGVNGAEREGEICKKSAAAN